MAEAAKAQLAEPPKRPPSSSLAAGIAPTGNEYRDRKARLYLPYISLVSPLYLLYISPPRPQGARGGRARERGAARADARGRTAHDCAEVKTYRQMRQQRGTMSPTDGVHRPHLSHISSSRVRMLALSSRASCGSLFGLCRAVKSCRALSLLRDRSHLFINAFFSYRTHVHKC